PIVADFGLAKAISTAGRANLTRSGLAVGTPGYMSPEQAGGGAELDERGGGYSLAIRVYEMLGGEGPGVWPREGGGAPGRFLKIPASHRACLTDAGSCVESALVRGLAIRSDERTPTPSELVAELTATNRERRSSEDQVVATRAASLARELATARTSEP